MLTPQGLRMAEEAERLHVGQTVAHDAHELLYSQGLDGFEDMRQLVAGDPLEEGAPHFETVFVKQREQLMNGWQEFLGRLEAAGLYPRGTKEGMSQMDAEMSTDYRECNIFDIADRVARGLKVLMNEKDIEIRFSRLTDRTVMREQSHIHNIIWLVMEAALQASPHCEIMSVQIKEGNFRDDPEEPRFVGITIANKGAPLEPQLVTDLNNGKAQKLGNLKGNERLLHAAMLMAEGYTTFEVEQKGEQTLSTVKFQLRVEDE